MKKKLFGNTSGLRKTQIKTIETLYNFRTPPDYIIDPELAHLLVKLSHEIRRQIGLLIDRNGKVIYVIVGEAQQIVIPVTSGYTALPGRLKGLRLIHTHLKKEPLTRDDLTDLALLRLDYITAVCITSDGKPGTVYSGHILPDENSAPYQVIDPGTIQHLNIDCLAQILALESELTRNNSLYTPESGTENAFLINATTLDPKEAWASMDELKELCKTSHINVIGTAVQRKKNIDPKFVVGKGKLSSLIIQAIQKYATMLVFNRELSASQIRSITDFVEMKVIDRTQLILDIFAKQAKSREGKYQVELAQMEYLLPRLITKNTAMSRLTGGIGGRGPGETKLELNRRRVRDRINRLKKEITKIHKQRRQQKSRRKRKDLPIISIVGYTNAGKSTLLNTLTQSKIIVANRLFATLDPSSRRLRFPRDTEVIITDTVGFIQDLPKELMQAFHATLEELADADIILHVIDISNPRYQQQKAAKTVSGIMRETVIPRCVEYMDEACLELVKDSLSFDLPETIKALLIIELDGDIDSVEKDAKNIKNFCFSYNALDVLVAKDQIEAQKLWDARKALSPILYKIASNKINEDVVVPIDKIPDLVQVTQQLEKTSGLKVVSFGHAGDGNIHCNIMYNKTDENELKRAEKAVDELFDATLNLGGTITGEHGVGMTKINYLPREIGATQIELMKGIKRVFDPQNILNPGKIFNL